MMPPPMTTTRVFWGRVGGFLGALEVDMDMIGAEIVRDRHGRLHARRWRTDDSDSNLPGLPDERRAVTETGGGAFAERRRP